MSTFDGEALKSTQTWRESSGVRTLQRMASVERYNRWVYKKLEPYVGTRVCEVGCGIGTMTPFFMGSERMTCIDVLEESTHLVRKAFTSFPQVETDVADIADSSIVQQLGAASFDTVVCINVLEHVERHVEALRNMRDLLRPGGRLLLFVPAATWLYGHLDEALGHYRRYSLAPLRELVVAQGFQIAEASYMNVAGIPGWFLSSRILRRDVPPRGLLTLFNMLTPIFVWAEETFHPAFGQSLVCVAQRPL